MPLKRWKIYSTSQAAWDAMYAAIAQAKKSIYWEMFIFLDDEVGQRFFELLEKKAGEGVEVKLIVDVIGSFSLPLSRVEALRTKGIDIRLFNERKFRVHNWWRTLVSRTHRKILVVDERIGFVGGVNIQASMRRWLDIHVRIEGAPVFSLLRAFARAYLISGGPRTNVEHLLSYRVPENKSDVEIIYDDAHTPRSKMLEKYVEAFRLVRERIILFSPYYFPDRKFRRALSAARRRGVHIDVILPFESDSGLAMYASHVWFPEMAKAGVHVYLLNQMMHGKGFVMDDSWAVVGTTNLDQTSFYDNYEVNVSVKDPHMVRDIKETVLGWLKKGKKIELTQWNKRGWLRKAKEKIAFAFFSLWHRRP